MAGSGKNKKRAELCLVQRQNARQKMNERKEQLRATQKQKEKEALQIVRKAATTLGEANAKALRHEVATLTAELAALKHGEAPKNEFPGDAMAAIRDELAVLRGEATQQEKLLAEIVELKSLVTQKAQLIKARDAEKAQLIKDRHDVTVYHMSHHDKLYEKIKKLKEQNEKLKNLVAEAGQQNGKLMAEKAQLIKDRDDVKERNEKLKSENAKLWHQNDAMAEDGLKRMAKSGF